MGRNPNTVQDPLCRFTKWLAVNQQHLERDPLAQWALLKPTKREKAGKKKRRAMGPDEMARALLALDAHDVILHRRSPQRIVFEALLVSGQRRDAFNQADVGDLDPEESRIHIPQDPCGKRVGSRRSTPRRPTASPSMSACAKRGPCSCRHVEGEAGASS